MDLVFRCNIKSLIWSWAKLSWIYVSRLYTVWLYPTRWCTITTKAFFYSVKSTHAVNHKIHRFDNCRFCDCSQENHHPHNPFVHSRILNNPKTLSLVSSFFSKEYNFIRHYLSFPLPWWSHFSSYIQYFKSYFFSDSPSNSHGKRMLRNTTQQQYGFIISQWGDVSFQSFYGF